MKAGDMLRTWKLDVPRRGEWVLQDTLHCCLWAYKQHVNGYGTCDAMLLIDNACRTKVVVNLLLASWFVLLPNGKIDATSAVFPFKFEVVE